MEAQQPNTAITLVEEFTAPNGQPLSGSLSQVYSPPIAIDNSLVSVSGQFTLVPTVPVPPTANTFTITYIPFITDTPAAGIPCVRPTVNNPGTPPPPYLGLFPQAVSLQPQIQPATYTVPVCTPLASMYNTALNPNTSTSMCWGARTFNHTEGPMLMEYVGNNGSPFQCSATVRNANITNMVVPLLDINTVSLSHPVVSSYDWNPVPTPIDPHDVYGFQWNESSVYLWPTGYFPWINDPTTFYALQSLPNNPPDRPGLQLPYNLYPAFTTNGTVPLVYGQGWHTTYCLDQANTDSTAPGRSYTIGAMLGDFMSPSLPAGCNLISQNQDAFIYYSQQVGYSTTSAPSWLDMPGARGNIQRYPIPGIAGITSNVNNQFTQVWTDPNFTYDHIDSYVRHIAFIYDETANPTSTFTNPITFPMNNSEDSAMTSLLTNPTVPYTPQIGHCFLPFSNPDGRLYAAGWPTPCNQITMNAPHGGACWQSDYAQPLATGFNLGNFSTVITCGGLGQTNAALLQPSSSNIMGPPAFMDAPHSQYDGATGAQAVFSTFDFPKNYSMPCGARELFYAPPTIVPTPLHQTAWTTLIGTETYTIAPADCVYASPTLLERPCGVTTEPRYVYSGRPAFIWDISGGFNVQPKLVTRSLTITIPPRSYTTEALIYEINKLISQAGGLVSEVDFQSGQYLCVASDYIDDNAVWRNPANNTNLANLTGPASAGHVGRGVHAFAGPNCVVKVGSSQFGFAQNGLSQVTITGTTELYCPTPLATSTLSATPSCFFLPYSFSRCPWDPVLVGDYGYKDLSGNVTAVDPGFLSQGVTYNGILMGDNSVETSYQNVNCSCYNTAGLDLFSLVAIQSVTPALSAGVGSQIGGSINSGNLSYQLTSIWSSTATNMTGSFNLMNYSSNTKFSVTLGDQLQSRLNANIYLNPWGSAVVNGPTGVVITSLHDGSDAQKQFWINMGFDESQFNQGFTPDIGYIRPVEGLMYNPAKPDGYYTNDPDQFCISNQSPYLYKSMSPTYLAAKCAKENLEVSQVLAALPTYPVTLVADTPSTGNYDSYPYIWQAAQRAPIPSGISGITNCPMFVTEPLRISPYRKEPINPPSSANDFNLRLQVGAPRWATDTLSFATIAQPIAYSDYPVIAPAGTFTSHDIGKNMYTLQGTLPGSFQPFWTPQPLIDKLLTRRVNGDPWVYLNSFMDTAVGFNSKLGCNLTVNQTNGAFVAWNVEWKVNTNVSGTLTYTLPNTPIDGQNQLTMDIFNNQKVLKGSLVGLLISSCYANTLQNANLGAVQAPALCFQTSGLAFGYPTCEPVCNRTWKPSNALCNILPVAVNNVWCSFAGTLAAGDESHYFHNLPSANAGWSACLREKWQFNLFGNSVTAVVPEIGYPNDVLANVIDQSFCAIPMYENPYQSGPTGILARLSLLAGRQFHIYDRTSVLPYRSNFESPGFLGQRIWPNDVFATNQSPLHTDWTWNCSTVFDCLAMYVPASLPTNDTQLSPYLPLNVWYPLKGCGASYAIPDIGTFIPKNDDATFYRRIYGDCWSPTNYISTLGANPTLFGKDWGFVNEKTCRSTCPLTTHFTWFFDSSGDFSIPNNICVDYVDQAGQWVFDIPIPNGGNASSINDIMGNLGARFPVQGRVHCDQITPGYLNVAPCLTDRGFSGLPTMLEIYEAGSKNYYNWGAEILRLQNRTDVIPHIKNYSLSSPLSLTFRFTNAQRFTPTSYITRPSLNFSSVVTPMNIIDYSGQDLSEPLQQENPVSVALVAYSPFVGASNISQAGYILLRLVGLDIISDNTTYINGDYNRSVFVCPIQAGLTNTQVIAFNTPLDLNVCAQSISTLNYELLGPSGDQLTGVLSARIFVNFTPTGQPTAAEQAFAMGETPQSITAQNPPAGYDMSGPTMSTPIPSASPPAKRSNAPQRQMNLPGARPGVAPRFHPTTFK